MLSKCIRLGAPVLAATMQMPVVGAQSPAFDAAAAFGVREEVSSVSLSPDGQRLAMIVADGARNRVDVVAASGGSPATVLAGIAGQRITDCGWTASSRIVCRVYGVGEDGGQPYGFTRLFAVDADGRNLRQLTSPQTSNALGVAFDGGRIVDLLPEEDDGAVLMTRTIIPEMSTGTRMAEERQGFALERVDTGTLRRRLVEPPRTNAVEYITDGHGTVRIIGERPQSIGEYSARYVHYCYRLVGARDCKPLSTVTDDGRGFNPFAVDRTANVAYGFDRHEGRQALFKVALDGSSRRELVLADRSVDVDGLIRVGRQRRVVGASFATERRQTVMFDPAMKAVSAAIARALPRLPNVAIVDASSDESRLLLVASSDDDPGRYYLYDRPKRELNELVAARPGLAAIKLSTVKPVTFPAADGTVIPGYLTLPPGSDGKRLPAIVMPHGGPGARDEWGFDWWAQYFANRGYAVLQPNFRGSTGYGDAWFQNNGFQSWRIAIGDIADGARWLVSQGIAAPAKLAAVGWSYGGYASLQAGAVEPELFKAIIAVAPVTDLETLRLEASRYTHFRSVDAFIGSGPHVRAGSPAQNAARIKAPVLLFHGERDLNVGVGHSRLMAARLRGAGRPVELIEFRGLDHQLDDSQARIDMLRRSDAFLRASLGL